MRKVPLKRVPFKAIRSPIKKISIKRQSEIIDKIAEQHKMHEMFYSIWNKRIHRCESCGVGLGNELRSYHFDHLLEKSKYSEYKLDEQNIILVCLPCHQLKTNGHPTEKHLEAINKIKELYQL